MAIRPPGSPRGNLTFEKYWTSINASGNKAIIGFSNILNAKSIEINVMAIPARVESKAALGVIRLRYPPINAPSISITPLRKQATIPIFHTKYGSLVAS